jgi:glutaconate CoA-transferase subunit A
LVLAPFGAYPHEVWGRYHADFDHFAEYTADIDARGVTTAVADYLARYVHAPATHEDYLDLFGGERLKRAQDAARELTPGVRPERA